VIASRCAGKVEATLVAPRPSVRLDVQDIAQLLAVFESIEANEGDARGELAAIQELRQRLTRRMLGTA
jgi:hypothetical protein